MGPGRPWAQANLQLHSSARLGHRSSYSWVVYLQSIGWSDAPPMGPMACIHFFGSAPRQILNCFSKPTRYSPYTLLVACGPRCLSDSPVFDLFFAALSGWGTHAVAMAILYLINRPGYAVFALALLATPWTVAAKPEYTPSMRPLNPSWVDECICDKPDFPTYGR